MMEDGWNSEFCDQSTPSHENEHEHEHQDSPETDQHDFCFNFDLLSLVSKAKDYYRILEVDFDASEEIIRSNYIRLALKWHPDKQKDQDASTSKFQEINEAYQGQCFIIS
ncbi:hypothetical protein V2J09_008513 [Rumex salicifolius]